MAHAEHVQFEGNIDDKSINALWAPPSRNEVLNILKQSNFDSSKASSDDSTFDLLVIGGGAVGSGVALDAATRGLKVALVEREDFSSGTSSRSTKLVHGGVRYLEKAFRKLDYGQFKLVREALHERATFLHIAPYLSQQLPIMLPIYRWWQIPYYWAGSKAYELLSGKEALESSYFLTRSKALEVFPMLKKDKLVGAVVFYDGQHNDARMNVAVALTAAYCGAAVANHVEVIKILKDESGTVNGARLRDNLTDEEWDVKAKGVISATGAFADGLRSLDDPKTEKIVTPSSGTHIILPNYYSPRNMGLLDPLTSDNRIIFLLPWQGNVIAGTTDSPADVTFEPLAKEEEIQWILEEIKRYLSADIKVRRGDVLAAWSGIRPLVRDPNAKNTSELVRSHMINVSDSKLITIAGGKWTTYRAMAEDTVDKAIEVYGLNPLNGSRTKEVKLIGSHGYSSTMFIKLIQQFGLETEVAQHLSNSYGDRAWAVAALSEPTGIRWPVFGQRIISVYPYITAEVRYAVRREYACTVVDVIARRTRLAFLNAQATLEALPKIVEIMSQELNWSPKKQTEEFDKAVKFLHTMGLPPSKDKLTIEKVKNEFSKPTAHESIYSRNQFQPEELVSFQKIFSEYDANGSGKIDIKDLEKIIKNIFGVNLSTTSSKSLVSRVKRFEEDKKNSNELIEFREFLDFMAAIKEEMQSKDLRLKSDKKFEQTRIPIERSSGGV
nr:12892_t:CDS:2 [Entrophospora candida]